MHTSCHDIRMSNMGYNQTNARQIKNYPKKHGKGYDRNHKARPQNQRVGETADRYTGYSGKNKTTKMAMGRSPSKSKRQSVDEIGNRMATPGRKRIRARPKTRWADDLNKYIGITWMRVARHCVEWKHHEEAFIQQ